MKLSVVVPSYNVSNYLEECVESIIQQEIDSMEVLLVNDGSTDNTLEIAYRLERKYEQVRVIDQPNGGLGNARNTGMKYAVGEYLTFVDSDDVITRNAYKKMLQTIEESGSDFVIGNVVRFNSTRTYPSVLHRRVFKENLIGVNINSRPELIYDTTAWNKIFKMDFWKKYDFKFPEKMLYEDIPVTLPAHSVASKVDVLTDVVYKWRARDAGDSSITQQKEKIENFVDRVKGIDMVRDFFYDHHVSEELKDAFDYKNLSMDFPLYLTYMLEVDSDYQNAVENYIKKYVGTVSTDVFMELSVLSRVKYRLIQMGRFNDFLELLKLEKQRKTIMKPRKIGKQLTFDYPFIDVLSEAERIADSDFVPMTWIEKVNWENDELKVSGVAYLNKLDSSLKNRTKYDVYLVDAETGVRITASKNSKMKFRPEITLKKGVDIGSKLPFKRLFNYNYSGFEVTISGEIFEKLNMEHNYFIELELSNSNITKAFKLKAPQKGFKTKPRQHKLNTSLISTDYNGAWEIYIRKLATNNSIEKVQLVDDEIILTGKTTSRATNLLLISMRSEFAREIPIKKNQEGLFEARISKQLYEEILTADDREKFDELISVKFEDTELLTYNNDNPLLLLGLGKTGQLTVMAAQDAIFRMRLGETLPVVTELSKTKEFLEFIFAVPNTFFDTAISSKIVMRGSEERVDLSYNIIKKNSYESLLKVQVPNSPNLHERVYAFYLSKEIEEAIYTKYVELDEMIDNDMDVMKESNEDTQVRIVDNQLTHEYLAPICLFNIGIDKVLQKNNGIKRELYHPFGKNHLQYRISSYWEKIDDGPRRQEVVRRVFYPLWRKLPIKKNYCVLESFWGREFSDNPKAIYEYLRKERPDLHYIIPIQDTLVKIDFDPENTEVVKLNSWRYIYALARSKYFFNNVNFPNYYVKRQEAIEVQTMHGTPLKRLGLDNPGEIPLHQIDNFIKKCQRWDYLTVPSDYVGEIAKSAYQFSNTLLNIGYPRNDSLFVYNTDIKEELLEKYQLPRDKKIILYAPTWRVKGKFSMPIDLHLMKEKLGDEYIIIIKLHHFMIKNFSLDDLDEFAFVFGRNSEISDFYKLADMLITDYSSVMFDYAILQKPMLFFTYDYDDYKNSLRGLYFDFKDEAPGPLIDNTEDLLHEIENISLYFDKYSERIEKFNKKYIQYDRGNASEELMKRIIE
ncbi:bifunctional glycosyltransferase/CDP-glycerol:glycerophosphate glycerophosphotransferase [Candidatus Enterococcus willemsii]|uniref:Glycosyltransferase 2-like domain-containing protein n=1 Tax=Candidatus Enterococcus willemsii TaxID=1857215 RepID=A0ABQ6Z102_9ENTE|nr:bifunctional glycosyltransferase/CDP-glycerol:glycerophosphate glycerophosphotransferase [Enterococcus sp. CU12B]KAF1305054.1 hypothetical protein BAU17_13920 [Enterococcus sp. CU12B]